MVKLPKFGHGIKRLIQQIGRQHFQLPRAQPHRDQTDPDALRQPGNPEGSDRSVGRPQFHDRALSRLVLLKKPVDRAKAKRGQRQTKCRPAMRKRAHNS